MLRRQKLRLVYDCSFEEENTKKSIADLKELSKIFNPKRGKHVDLMFHKETESNIKSYEIPAYNEKCVYEDLSQEFSFDFTECEC